MKIQDQLGMPVNTMKVPRFPENQWKERCAPPGFLFTTPIQKYNQLIEISDDEVPFNRKEPLCIVTEQELKEDAARVEEEKKAWREKVAKKEAEKKRKKEEEERKREEERDPYLVGLRRQGYRI